MFLFSGWSCQTLLQVFEVNIYIYTFWPSFPALQITTSMVHECVEPLEIGQQLRSFVTPASARRPFLVRQYYTNWAVCKGRECDLAGRGLLPLRSETHSSLNTDISTWNCVVDQRYFQCETWENQIKFAWRLVLYRQNTKFCRYLFLSFGNGTRERTATRNVSIVYLYFKCNALKI